ncbi:glycoside hydrolase, partial [bacterium]|nr:glycoside hydrolase [bacterium]
MTDRTHTVFLSLLLACAASAAAAPESFPPQKPDPMPEFYIPAAGAALDEQWVFIDTLFDAAANRPDLFSAYPVELVFSKSGRGYLAMLHTVFRTVTYGESWSNLDLAPPPAVNLTWEAVRSPAYIYGIGLRYTTTTASEGDSLFLAVVNGDAELGHVRLIRDIGGAMSLWTFPQLSMNRWITEVASSEHNSAVAFAGLDGRIYRQHIQTTLWDTLDYNFFGSWIDDVEVVGARIIAAGSHFIISEDNGVTWEAFPTADPTGVRDLSFAPDGLHGLACGETEIGGGWVRYTEDGGATWSERTLSTIDPLHAVKMISATVGFAGGGNVNNASGRIHRTSDGGRTWEIELLCNADIRAISSSRRSAAYVFAVAAGVFPDFSCGVWRSRVFSPAPDGPVLAAFPDTLDFGLIEV